MDDFILDDYIKIPPCLGIDSGNIQILKDGQTFISGCKEGIIAAAEKVPLHKGDHDKSNYQTFLLKSEFKNYTGGLKEG